MKALTATALILLLTAAPATAQVQQLTAWWTATGETDSTLLGSRMIPLGDINEDGLADFAVLAAIGSLNPYYYDRIFVYLGSATPNPIPYLSFSCPDTGMELFGIGLFSVGDVDGDSGPDFVAAAEPHVPIGYAYWRKAYLYQGGAQFDTIPYMTFIGDSCYGSSFGLNGNGLGDINGDGYNDFALLDFNYEVSYPPEILGRIYVYYGGPNLHNTPDLIIHADSVLNRIGWKTAPLGDVNSDGYDDFVISDDRCDVPGISGHPGVVAIYHGGNPPDTIPASTMHGTANAHLGVSLTTLDWNGDGQLDIFAGNGTFYPPAHHGSVWEYNVSEIMTGQPDHVFLAENGEVLGSNLWHVDLNGDGRQDLVDGEPWYAYCGKVYVFLNGSRNDTLFDATFYQGNFMSYLGGICADIGDINGDGNEDMVVGENNFQQGRGRFYVILGSDSLHQSGIELLPRPALPQTAALLEAFPNPFNGQVVLEIDAPSLKDNTIKIYNLEGKLVRQFHLGYGQRRAVWDGRSASGQNCATGIYWAKLTGPSYQITQKLVFIR